ncbi:hypothetical protein SAY87_027888 [Trapa incisa]|uniref:Uncharacterized protein n=1 Tax=Trapa incisa TaxID=236973 RepID=A0AAN7KUL1_9MYRT|nr:hypothetical protein SAY87_027888 [Trapa incisa]
MAFNCTSRLETKRSHQWLMDDPRIDLIPIRKQAVGLRNNHSFLESLNSCPSQWGIASGFHTSLGHFGEQSFDLASSGVNNYNGRGIPLIGARKMNVSEKMMGKEHHSILSSGQGYQTDSCTMSMSQLYNQEGNNSSGSVGNSYHKTENVAYPKIGKGQSTIISFGGCDDDTGRVGAGDNSEKGEPHMTEKIPSNNFPSNVGSLLSTGILDGVHVKYMAWSQEKDLPGIIRGCGYLCGCSSCNRSKVHSPHTITPCMALIYMPYSYILRATLRSSQTLCGLEHFKIGFPCSHGLVPGLTGRALIAEASSSPIVFLFLSSFSFFALTRCCSA